MPLNQQDLIRKVLSYFPEYPVKRGEKTIYDVTIKHLLTMRAPYKGHGDPWTKVCSSEGWTAASLDFLGGRKGITEEFDYWTVCLHILSGILYKATGMKTVDFANQSLFLPLGIQEHENYYAETAAEHKQFTMDKLPRRNVWFSDPQGLGTPGYGLWFLRILSLLYLTAWTLSRMYCCRLYNSLAFRRHKVWKMKFILIYNRISECSQMDSLAKRIEWGNIQ